MFDAVPIDGPDGTWPRLGEAVTAWVSALLRKLIVVVLVGSWAVFWGLVMRLQVTQQEFLSATVVGLLFIVPALAGLSAYLDPLPNPGRLIPS